MPSKKSPVYFLALQRPFNALVLQWLGDVSFDRFHGRLPFPITFFSRRAYKALSTVELRWTDF